jgi:hypothetical protein
MFARLLKDLFTSRSRSNTRRSTTHLRLESLEARDVPAVVNLTTQGASGAFSGALFRQTDSIEATTAHPFLRLQTNSVKATAQQGYNTDARPLQFDEVSDPAVTHSILVQDLPLVTINGLAYREILLDVSQNTNQPQITLDELRIYTSNSQTLSGYKTGKGTLGGVRAIYDMDASGNNRVLLNTLLSGAAFGDMRLDLPNSLFAGGGQYFYLYSKFGATTAGLDDRQTWAVVPPVVQGPGSISGVLFQDDDNSGTFETGEPVLAGWTVYIDTHNFGVLDADEVRTTTNASGNYQFTGLPVGSAGSPVAYTVSVVVQQGWIEGATVPSTVFLDQTMQSATQDLALLFQPT